MDYTFSPSGGIALGGAVLPATAYHFAPSGGVAIGGNLTKTSTTYNFTSSGGIALRSKVSATQKVVSNATVIGYGRSKGLTQK